MADPLFSARPAGDGTDEVLIRVDATTAHQLADAWDHTHVSIPENALTHPRWFWDVAAVRRAAADAAIHAYATAQAGPVRPAALGLRLVEAVKTS